MLSNTISFWLRSTRIEPGRSRSKTYRAIGTVVCDILIFAALSSLLFIVCSVCRTTNCLRRRERIASQLSHPSFSSSRFVSTRTSGATHTSSSQQHEQRHLRIGLFRRQQLEPEHTTHYAGHEPSLAACVRRYEQTAASNSSSNNR